MDDDLHSDDELGEHILVTGFPAFTAKRMIQKLAVEEEGAHICVLAREKFRAQAQSFVKGMEAGRGTTIEVLVGDVCDMDLGLSGDEFRKLSCSVTAIHHLAGIYYMGVDKKTAERVNIEGTRGILRLAHESPRLRRLMHWSTALVSGKRRGVVMEDELDVGQGFHNFYEETKLEAENLAHEAKRELPITILRPGLIVGDSVSGEIDKFDGPYYLMVLIATNALQMRIPMPGRGTAPMHLVPIDFVIDAAYALSIDETAAGLTFHLTDSNPLPARRVYERIAELSDTKLARSHLPSTVTRTLLRTPGVERLARGPLSFLDSLDQQVFYNCKNTLAHLAGTGIRCPSFDDYAGNLVRYLRSVREGDRDGIEDEVFDPFD